MPCSAHAAHDGRVRLLGSGRNGRKREENAFIARSNIDAAAFSQHMHPHSVAFLLIAG